MIVKKMLQPTINNNMQINPVKDIVSVIVKNKAIIVLDTCKKPKHTEIRGIHSCLTNKLTKHG